MRRDVGLGFTLVELVVVIAVVGILAAIAVPRFIDIRAEAYNAQRESVVGSMRSGILLIAAKNQVAGGAGTFPPNLEAAWNGIPGGTLETDGTTCSTAKACAELIVPGGIDDGNWAQTTATSYTFTPPVGTTKTYTYDPTDGTFR